MQTQFLTRTETLKLLEQFCVGPPVPSMLDALAEAVSILSDMRVASLS